MTTVTGGLTKSLADQLVGRLLGPGDKDYDATRSVWNAMVDRRPQLIGQCQRDAMFEFVAAAGWSDPAEGDARIAAARRTAAALEPFASGAYVNTLSDEGARGVSRAYSPDKLARLTALKDAYDPANVFHLNQNVRPSGA